ncbi:MAG TPA: sulfotransferase [Planctomycetota bacterium]|nr:sulfotransferase [Planctomycetota bacterium]
MSRSLPERIEPVLVRTLRLENRFPPLFVVGAPRTGTTLALQVLAGGFRFAWFTNASNNRPLAPVWSAWRSLRAHPIEASFTSDYGRIEGPSAPSDGWRVLKRWFPLYDDSAPVQRLGELRTTVRLLERLFGAPFLLKNNHNSTRIDALAGLFGSALFVHVTRSLPEAAASLLEARARHRVPLGAWWSASPPAEHGRRFTSELEQVVRTLRGLDEHLRSSLTRLPRDRWLAIDYEALCAEPGRLLGWTARTYAASGVRLEPRGEVPPSFRPSRLGPARRFEIERAIGELEQQGFE